MNRALFPLLGLIAAAAIVGGGLFLNRGSHVVIRGEIKKVRTHEVDEKSSVAVVDFRLSNNADYPFVVRTVQIFMEGPAAEPPVEGAIVADVDARRVMQAIPELGPKYNDSLKVRDRILPKTSHDRMLAARFEVPVTDLNRRKQFRIRVEEVDGAISELIEANGPTN